jgi:hypothetical protein
MNQRGLGIQIMSAKDFGAFMIAADEANGKIMKDAGLTK